MKTRLWLGVFLCGLVLAGGAGVLLHKPVKAVPQDKVRASGKIEFLRNSRVRSDALTREAVDYLKVRKINEAVQSLVAAIDVFPMSTEAYSLLVKIYLITQQERKLYQTLERAGRSYPGFDNILAVVNDADLARIPVDPPAGDAYIAPFKGNKRMALSYMFDDGEASVYTDILPMLDAYGYKATVSVIPGKVALSSGDPFWGSWAEWKDAAARGFEIANHSMHHRDAKTLTPEELKVEVEDAKALIEKNVGAKVVSYVFPMDSYSAGAMQYISRTHLFPRQPDFLRSVYGRSVDIMYGGPNFSVVSANRLVDIGISRNLWLIAECHGLDEKSSKSYKPLSADFLRQHLAYVNARAADVWVDTFAGVFDYLLLVKAGQVVRSDIDDGQADVVLRNSGVARKLPQPLTVVLKARRTPVVVRAATSAGVPVKAWVCGENSVCVDIGAWDEPVRVIWAKGQG